jgi:hypothetical protein
MGIPSGSLQLQAAGLWILGPSHTTAQNASVVTHFVTSGNCGIPENMCWKEIVLSQTIMDTVARFHKVRYNGRILCARVAPALDLLLVPWDGVRRSPLGTSATNWPTVPAPDDRWWWMWAFCGIKINRGTEVLGENLPQCHLVHHKSHMSWPGLEPGSPRWEAGD